VEYDDFIRKSASSGTDGWTDTTEPKAVRAATWTFTSETQHTASTRASFEMQDVPRVQKQKFNDVDTPESVTIEMRGRCDACCLL